MGRQPEPSALADAFRRADLDGDGLVDRAEFEALCGNVRDAGSVTGIARQALAASSSWASALLDNVFGENLLMSEHTYMYDS